MLKKLALCLTLVALAACDLEKMDGAPPPEDPTIIQPEAASETQAVVVCDEIAPVYCARGYRVEFSETDGTKAYCLHIVSCPVVDNPCRRGTMRGDPTYTVTCQGVSP